MSYKYYLKSNGRTGSEYIRFIKSRNDLPTDRSVLRADSRNWCLVDEMHDWLVEMNIDYSLDFDYQCDAWCVVFENESQAALFKLTWYGK